MLKERTFTIIYVSESSSIGYDPDAKGEEVIYNGEEKMKIKLE